MILTILFYFLGFVLVLLSITIVVVVVRTILFQRSQGTVAQVEVVPVDPQQVAEHLAAAVRCQTVPLDDTGTPDPEAFRQLHHMLADTYPLVHQRLKRETINDYSLLYTWPGSRPDVEPDMLMAHQDVVSFANIWLFGLFLLRWLTALPEMTALIRTTTALTIVEGGVEDNTIYLAGHE